MIAPLKDHAVSEAKNNVRDGDDSEERNNADAKSAAHCDNFGFFFASQVKQPCDDDRQHRPDARHYVHDETGDDRDGKGGGHGV